MQKIVVAIVDTPLPSPTISSIAKLRKVVQYATFESELFDLLLFSDTRDSLKKLLLENLKDDGYDPVISCKTVFQEKDLFRRYKDLLDTFLSTGAISQAQYDKSLSYLIEKNGD
ncbi:hypothetical protein [Victivallis vadensis]|uniref:hypothetical protein n=1 Tax=Victivallis vadensis TaxID=172901 RepID=UPI003CFC53E8